MSARSERTTSGSALYQGVGFRRAARLVLAVLVGSLVILAIARGSMGVADAAALAGIVIGVAALWEARVRRIGIRIGPQGVLAVYAVGHLRIPLESVAGFSLRHDDSHDGARRVVIDLLSGEQRVVPSGLGAVQDMAQLAGQLQRARQQAAAAFADGMTAR